MTEQEIGEMVAAAAAAREHAYVPYSHFMVGAALRAVDGRLFTGCNVENASYGITMCAERNALFHAVAEGARAFTALAVVTENGVTPCGACRQALAEFARSLPIVVSDVSGRWQLHDLTDLLPHAFVPQDLADAGNLPAGTEVAGATDRQKPSA